MGVEFKDFKEVADYLDKLEKDKMFNRSDLTNIIKGVSPVSQSIGTGTINSGDATTDAIISDLRTGFGQVKEALNTIISNIGKQ